MLSKCYALYGSIFKIYAILYFCRGFKLKGTILNEKHSIIMWNNKPYVDFNLVPLSSPVRQLFS